MTHDEMVALREETADRVLITAVKTIAELSRAGDLKAYSKHNRIVTRISEKYQVKVTFALHTGRAVEGAIGS